METLQKYQRLKAEFKKLKEDYKYIRKNLERECKDNMQLEAEILDINTNTMNNIVENNKRFNLN
jgi:septal ring factor EnvC (AmiA/AmiB activator)